MYNSNHLNTRLIRILNVRNLYIWKTLGYWYNKYKLNIVNFFDCLCSVIWILGSKVWYSDESGVQFSDGYSNSKIMTTSSLKISKNNMKRVSNWIKASGGRDSPRLVLWSSLWLQIFKLKTESWLENPTPFQYQRCYSSVL